MIRALAIAAAALAVSVTAAAPSQASALAFVVDSTVDAVDAQPGDGICATTEGDCTFRASVQETNALPGHQTIMLPAGEFALTIPGYVENAAAAGDVDVTGHLTILGAGAEMTLLTEESGGVERVIDVREDADVVISDLTIHDVFMSAILPSGTENCGGGIRNHGSLTAFRLVVRDNIFRRGGGGVCNDEGGVLKLTDSLIEHNCACLTGPGGGILNAPGGFAVLENLTISGNSGDTTGGGGVSNLGTMIVRDSLITGNGATNDADGAGGIDNRKVAATGSLTIFNSTISGNHIEGSRGGGVSNQDNGTVTLVNSTVTGNTTDSPVGGGVSTDEGSTTTLINTIVAGNENFDCEQGEPFFGGAPPISGGHNIDSDGSCQLSGLGDLSAVDPLLGELADNGGPTFTHALLDGSPAIDAADDAECPATDQRGAPRPFGDGCASAPTRPAARSHRRPRTSRATPTATAQSRLLTR